MSGAVSVIRNRGAGVPFQGTAMLVHGGPAAGSSDLVERVGEVFRRQTALRLVELDVSRGEGRTHRLAELAVRVAEANPCLLLVADDAARFAVQRWRPFYPATAPATFGLLPYRGEGRGPLTLEDGTELEAWLDGGTWRDSAAFGRLGVRDGISVEGIGTVLSTLARLAPSPIELFLSYAKIFPESSPLGNIALRIGETVYPFNPAAVRGVEAALMQPVPLADFLYGTRSALVNVEVTDTIGACFGRNVLGLRLMSVPRISRARMLEAIEEINNDWTRGAIQPGSFQVSPAMLLSRVMHSGGFALRPRVPRGPLDLFSKILWGADREGTAAVLVHYRRVPISQSCFQEDAFPRRLFWPWTSESHRRALETRAQIRVEAESKGRKLELDARAYQWGSTVSRGRRVLLVPGPVNVAQAIRDPGLTEIGDREPVFGSLFEDATRKLLALVGAQPERYQALLIGGSGGSAVEASVEAMARVGRLVVVSNGECGDRLAQLAALYRPEATHVVEFAPGAPVDTSAIRRALKPYKGQSVFVLIAHHETSTGMLNHLDDVAVACKDAGALLFVDAAGSIGAHPIDVPGLGISLCAGAPHIALGGVAGISFVVGDRNLFRRLAQTEARVRCLDLAAHYKLAVEKAQMPDTAPLPLVISLARAIGRVLDAGLDGVAGDFARRAAHTRRELMGIGLQFPIEVRSMSNVLTPVLLPPGIKAADVHEALLARGYVTHRCGPPHADDGLHIAHAGDLSAAEITEFVSVLEKELAHLLHVASAAETERAAGLQPARQAAAPGERGSGAVPPSSTDAARPQGEPAA